MTDYQDRTLTCKECGEEFTFTARDQEFYAKNGFTDPKKCKPCRDAAKASRNNRGDRNSFNNFRD